MVNSQWRVPTRWLIKINSAAYQNKWDAVPDEGFSSHDLAEGGLWKVIRAFPVPNIFNYFFCGGFHNILPTLKNLMRKEGVHVASKMKSVWVMSFTTVTFPKNFGMFYRTIFKKFLHQSKTWRPLSTAWATTPILMTFVLLLSHCQKFGQLKLYSGLKTKMTV